MFNSQQIIARTYKSTVLLYDTLQRRFMLSTCGVLFNYLEKDQVHSFVSHIELRYWIADWY